MGGRREAPGGVCGVVVVVVVGERGVGCVRVCGCAGCGGGGSYEADGWVRGSFGEERGGGGAHLVGVRVRRVVKALESVSKCKGKGYKRVQLSVRLEG